MEKKSILHENEQVVCRDSGFAHAIARNSAALALHQSIQPLLISGFASSSKETGMTSTIKGKVADAGHAVADAAKTAGHQIVEGNGTAVDFVKDKTRIGAGIKEHMDVIASCGKKSAWSIVSRQT